MTPAVRPFTLAAAVGAATMGGVYFAFSTFVMRGLRQLPANEGIAAMNAINRAAPTPLFMTALVGTAAMSVGLGVVAINRHDGRTSTYLLIGGGLYLVSVVLTAAYHVPRNDALLLVDPTGSSAVSAWRRYGHDWTLWNHVRTVTSMAGAVAFALAFRAE